MMLIAVRWTTGGIGKSVESVLDLIINADGYGKMMKALNT